MPTLPLEYNDDGDVRDEDNHEGDHEEDDYSDVESCCSAREPMETDESDVITSEGIPILIDLYSWYFVLYNEHF